VILKNLKAKMVHANSQSGRLQADHQISAVILRYQKSGVQPVQVFAEQLLYDSNTLQTQLLKDVRLHEGDNKIYTQEALLDHGSQQVFFKQGILFKHAQDTLRAPQLTIAENRNEYHFSGGVSFSRENLQSYCQEVISIMQNNLNRAQLLGKIKVRQRGKILLGENGFYDEVHDSLTISKNAELLMNQSGTLPEEGDLSRLQRQDIKNLLENEILVKADQLIVQIGSGDVEAMGHVSIKRKNQQARALRAHFNQKEHQILLSDSAEIQQADGNWVSAEQVLVNTQTQEFTALGKVETTIFHNEQ
jgi:lipopolysaccharide export system protein LptA